MKKNLKTNLIFAAVLLVVAFGLLIWQMVTAEPGMEAVLSYGNNKVQRFSLSEDGVRRGYRYLHRPSGGVRRGHPVCGFPLPGS